MIVQEEEKYFGHRHTQRRLIEQRARTEEKDVHQLSVRVPPRIFGGSISVRLSASWTIATTTTAAECVPPLMVTPTDH